MYQSSERICPKGIECDGMLLGSLAIGSKVTANLPLLRGKEPMKE